MSFFELLVAPQVWPFSLSLLLFAAIVVLEVVLAMTGFGSNVGFDVSLDLDLPDPTSYSKFLDWLGIGRVPYLITLAAFLLCFGFLGLFAQTLLFELTTLMLPWPLVAFGSIAASLPLVRMIDHGLGRIWPKDIESSAVSQDSLIGHEAEVVLGNVTSNAPGQIKIRDPQGTLHYGLAIADNSEDSFAPGEHLLVVGRRGVHFTVIRHPNPSHSTPSS